MLLPLTVSCFSKIQIGFTFLVPAHLGSPGKRAVKRVCVCVCCDDHDTVWRQPSLTATARTTCTRTCTKCWAASTTKWCWCQTMRARAQSTRQPTHQPTFHPTWWSAGPSLRRRRVRGPGWASSLASSAAYSGLPSRRLAADRLSRSTASTTSTLSKSSARAASARCVLEI